MTYKKDDKNIALGTLNIIAAITTLGLGVLLIINSIKSFKR